MTSCPFWENFPAKRLDVTKLFTTEKLKFSSLPTRFADPLCTTRKCRQDILQNRACNYQMIDRQRPNEKFGLCLSIAVRNYLSIAQVSATFTSTATPPRLWNYEDFAGSRSMNCTLLFLTSS